MLDPATHAKLLAAQNLLDAGKAPAALANLQRLGPKAAALPEYCDLLCAVHTAMSNAEQAIYFAQRAHQLTPDNFHRLFQYATTLQGTGKLDKAEPLLKLAMERSPDSGDALLALANLYLETFRAGQGLALLKEAVTRFDNPQIAISYTNALLSVTEVEEAAAFTRRAIARYPDEPELHAALAAAIINLHGATPREIADAHAIYGQRLMQLRPPVQIAVAKPANPGKKLRIGIISQDLRTHSVAFFAEPWFEHHNRAEFEIYAYSLSHVEDAFTARLKKHSAAWRKCNAMSSIDIAHKVAADGVDILLDLAGLTDRGSLATLALRAAPVQATYCGYPDTTGLPTVDWRIVDAKTDPLGREAVAPGQPTFDERVTERLWRLEKSFLCYRPPADAPAPGPREAALAPGPVFGSFNACKKLSRGTTRLWARVLNACPGSSMVIKAFDLKDASVQERLLARFAADGVGPDRLTLLPATKGIDEHLRMYQRMDIALDPTPYNGTTTTCEALWMGVPAITVAGATHAARVGVSLLSTVGLEDLVAADEDDYVAKAAALAQDRPRLAAMRQELRPAMAASALCDESAFAARFGAALRGMWVKACQGA